MLLTPEISNIQVTKLEHRLGLVYQVDFKNTAIGTADNINFKIHLEGKYPFQPPKITCETVFMQPSISDGRDLLENVIKKTWSADITILELISYIKSFLEDLKSNYNPHIGRFKLGQPLHLSQFQNKPDIGLFKCYELDPQNPKITRDRVLIITHTYILQLELNSLYDSIGHLIAVSSLHFLSAIKKGRSDPDRLIFE